MKPPHSQSNRVVVPIIAALLSLAVLDTIAEAQKSTGPSKGTLIVDGGGATKAIVQRFVELAGGPRARIVVFPTGGSSIRFGEQNIIVNPDLSRDKPEWRAYEAYLKQWLGIDNVSVLHTRDRKEADTGRFVESLKTATGVYLAPGNSGQTSTPDAVTASPRILAD